MDRKDNDFLFSGLKGNQKDNQKKIIQKIQQDKEQLKISKEQFEKSVLIQRYLRGRLARVSIYKKMEAEMLKNL